MSKGLHKKQKRENYSNSSSKRRKKNRKNKKPVGREIEVMKKTTQSSIFDDEIEGLCINNIDFDVDDDAEIAMQQILFDSAQLYYGKKSISSKSAGKKVMDCCSVSYKSFSKVKGIREKGGPSCTYCIICDDAKPPNTLIYGSSCEHCYCEECIMNYVKENINDDIQEVKCPVSNCKRILDLEYLMPEDFLVRVKDVIRETEVLASPMVIDCPFYDCKGELIDDKKDFLMRACPKCWRIFCVKCRKSCHVGMSCATYQQKNSDSKLIELLPYLPEIIRKIRQTQGHDDDDEDGTSMPIQINFL